MVQLLRDARMNRVYTWGLDMSGLSGVGSASGVGPASSRSTDGIHGAGGIGGLLAAEEAQATGGPKNYWFLYDANGNVGQVLDATNEDSITTAAKYEYDPYGNTLAATGTYAAANPFRFSTKWFDTETGLSYYGYRYYNVRLGRWMSRDPIEELGGLNLYVVVQNNPALDIDPLGQGITIVRGGTVGAAIAAAALALQQAVKSLSTCPCVSLDSAVRAASKKLAELRGVLDIATCIVTVPLEVTTAEVMVEIAKARERCEPKVKVCPLPKPGTTGRCHCFDSGSLDSPLWGNQFKHGTCATDSECSAKCKLKGYLYGLCRFE